MGVSLLVFVHDSNIAGDSKSWFTEGNTPLLSQCFSGISAGTTAPTPHQLPLLS